MSGRLLIFLFLLCAEIVFAQKFRGGISYGFGYSALQYSAEKENAISKYPAKFIAAVPDANGDTLRGQMVFPSDKFLWGFTAQFEAMLFRFPASRIYHGPHVFVSYQKSNLIEANMWAPGYFFRYKRPNSNTGLQFNIHIFPRNKFMIDLDSLSYPAQSNYFFDGRSFGDSLRAVYTETKTSLMFELSGILAVSKKFDLRLSAGCFLVLNSKKSMRIVAENGQDNYSPSSFVYDPDGKSAGHPLISPGLLYVRAGLYLTEFIEGK